MPPTTAVGAIEKDDRFGGLIVRVAETDTLPVFAVIATVARVDTAVVLTENPRLVLPTGIVTEAGTVTDLSPLDRWMIVPPFGAPEFRFTVPVD